MELAWQSLRRFKDWTKEECLAHDDAVLVRKEYDDFWEWLRFHDGDTIGRNEAMDKLSELSKTRFAYRKENY